jgi:glycerol dehydrogenase-like iron-containing ADH family enzyme
MELMIRAPMRYIQFAGALDKMGDYAGNMGRHILVVCSEGSRKRIGPRLDQGLLSSGCTVHYSAFSGACTRRRWTACWRNSERPAAT